MKQYEVVMEYHEVWHYRYRVTAENEDEAALQVLVGISECLEGEYQRTIYDETQTGSVGGRG
jgi:hypothetical protein